MSRHRDVRNMDYDDLMDEEAGEGDMSPSDAVKLDQAVESIISIIGSGFSIKDVKDAAWHYYFDLEQSTAYLLDQRDKKLQEKSKRAQDASTAGMSSQEPEVFLPNAPSPKRAYDVTLGACPVPPVTPVPDNSTTLAEEVPPQPLKKLSKIQQLKQARLAAKKASNSSSVGAEQSHDLSSQPRDHEEKEITGCDIDHGMPENQKLEAVVRSLPESPLNATTSGTVPWHIESGSHDLQEAPLAPPSDFASVVLATSYSATKLAETSFSRPSPDDIILKAQSGSKSISKGKPSTAVNKTLEPEVAPKVIPKASNKPRHGRPKEHSTQKNISLVVVGHVDAGKSTLFGRLLYDMKIIDERAMQKLRKESEKMQKASFAYAWAMDSSAEERERGVTIDIATNTFVSEGITFTVLDAPGHKDFVPNMIAGASQADFAILVVDASRGAFESGFDAAGQTKEHAVLLRSLGIQRLIVAVNKLDNVAWSEDRFQDIKVQLTTFLTQIGFDPATVSFTPCSGLSGANVTAKVHTEAAAWYTGHSLLQEMHTVKSELRDESGAFRMMISDIQTTPNSSNFTVLGRLSSGEVQVDDTVLCLPSKEFATVKSLVSGDNIVAAFAGDNVTITLSNIDEMYIKVGDVLCHPTNSLSNVTTFMVQVITFEMLRPLLSGSSVVLHRGRTDLPAVIRKIQVMDKSKGSFKSSRHVLGGCQAILKIDLVTGSLPLEVFASNKDLGRMILRREGDTVAAGIVTELL